MSEEQMPAMAEPQASVPELPPPESATETPAAAAAAEMVAKTPVAIGQDSASPRSALASGGRKAARQGPNGGTVLDSRGCDKLYKDGAAREERRKQLQAQATKECTFRPQLIAKGRSPSVDRRRTVGTPRKPTAAPAVTGPDDPPPTPGDVMPPPPPGAEANGHANTVAADGQKGAGVDAQLTAALAKHEHLYSEAGQRKKRQEQREKEGPTMNGCTFKPEISEKARRQSSNGPKEDPFKRLSTNKEDQAKRLAEAKAKKREQEAAGCTFKPSISRSTSAAKGRPGVTEEPTDIIEVSKRLYEDRDTRDHRQHLLHVKKEEREKQGCTFKPDTSLSRSSSAQHKRPGAEAQEREAEPIETRLAKYMEMRQAKMDRLKQEQAERQKQTNTFHPKLSKKSSEVAMKKKDPNENIYERLAQMPVKGEKSQTRQEQLQERDMAECTFKPKLVARAQSAGVKQRPNANGGAGPASPKQRGPVFERLNQQLQVQEERRRKLEVELQAERMRECTFRPSTGKRPKKEANAEPGAGPPDSPAPARAEGEGPVWQRLNENRAEVSRLREQMKHQIELEACTFQPTLVSRRSSTDGRGAARRPSEVSASGLPVHERLFNLANAPPAPPAGGDGAGFGGAVPPPQAPTQAGAAPILNLQAPAVGVAFQAGFLAAGGAPPASPAANGAPVPPVAAQPPRMVPQGIPQPTGATPAAAAAGAQV